MNFKLNRFTPLALGLALFLGLLSLLSVAQASTPPEVSGPNINELKPSLGCNDRKTWVYIYGSGFTKPLTVTLNSRELTVDAEDFSSDRIYVTVPAEMSPALYDLRVQTEEGSYTYQYAYNNIKPTDIDDLTSHSAWLWTEQKQLQVGYPNSGVGLNVQRLGGCQENEAINVIENVEVEFIRELPTGDQVLGHGYIPLLSPLSVEPTSKVIWEPQESGQYDICAIIDPDDDIEESDETNNRTCRTVTVLDNSDSDITPPVVHEFFIEDDATETAQITVSLDVTATDMLPEPRSGVDKVKFIEYEYNLASGNWVPIPESSWVNYKDAHQNYPWTLIKTYGVRYLEAKAMDKAGHISLDSESDFINLLPTEQSGALKAGEFDFYRIHVDARQTLSATLTSIGGDTDLHIWGPNYYHESSTNDGTVIDSLSVEVPETGIYQIEVEAYSDASYRLSFETNNNTSAIEFRGFHSSSKTPPDAPRIRLDDYPGNGWIENENNDIGGSPAFTYIYLPMTIR